MNRIGTAWRRLALNLDPSIKLDVIERENKTEYERAHAILQQIRNKNPAKFTMSIVIQALIAAERRDIAEIIYLMQQ